VSDLRSRSKPIVIAGNKSDIAEARKNAERLPCIPCSAEAELALRKAAEAGLIAYQPGDSDFQIVKEPEEKQKRALEFIREHVLKPLGSTGVQNSINTAVFKVLDMIVVYPVENENKFSDKSGNVLPDALLVRKGTTAKQLAGKIHTAFEERFLAAIDAKTKKRISADHVMQDGDIVKIVLNK
jgi:ribosome-binding ATPase YchF (GTP1/OBG family)